MINIIYEINIYNNNIKKLDLKKNIYNYRFNFCKKILNLVILNNSSQILENLI